MRVFSACVETHNSNPCNKHVRYSFPFYGVVSRRIFPISVRGPRAVWGFVLGVAALLSLYGANANGLHAATANGEGD